MAVPQTLGEEAPGHDLWAQEALPLVPLVSSCARLQGLELVVSGLFIETSR